MLTDFSTETVNNSLQRRLDRFDLFDSMDSPALNRHRIPVAEFHLDPASHRRAGAAGYSIVRVG